MEDFLIIFLSLSVLLLPPGGFLLYRYYKRKKSQRLEIAFETENPINTQDFTFEKAVEECHAAISQISELNEKFEEIDKIVRAKQNVNGGWINMLNYFFKKGAYKENKNYPESEKNKEFRVFYKKSNRFTRLLLLLLLSSMPLCSGVTFEIFLAWIVIPWFILLGLIVYKNYMTFKTFKAVRKECKMYPWRFIVLPLGSQMYIFQEEGNDIFEKIHRAYYDVYLPCKRKADELVRNYRSREDEYYKAYMEFSKCDIDIYACTPWQRIKKLQKELHMKNIKRAVAITSVVTVAVTAGFTSMASNAAKDVGMPGKK